MYNTAILQRGLASVSLQIALEVYPITNDPVNFATGRTVPRFVTIHKLQEVPPSDTFSPALPPAILCPWQKKKIQLCPLSWIWITSQMTSVTRQIQGTQFFLTLAFLSLCLFLKSAGTPLQNISNSEAELMGRKRQTQDTAGSLAEMLSWSITEKLEIMFRISFKNKFCKSSA